MATHRRTHTTHVAGTLTGNRKLTRCGLVMRVEGRDYRMFTWTKVGSDPPLPTCRQCRRFVMDGHPSSQERSQMDPAANC